MNKEKFLRRLKRVHGLCMVFFLNGDVSYNVENISYDEKTGKAIIDGRQVNLSDILKISG